MRAIAYCQYDIVFNDLHRFISSKAMTLFQSLSVLQSRKQWQNDFTPTMAPGTPGTTFRYKWVEESGQMSGTQRNS